MANRTDIDFIGIGAGRAGTTWILEALSEHPQIFFPYAEKLNYFSNPHSEGGPSEYEKAGIQPYLKLFEDAPKGKLTGEFSSHYMPDPKVAPILRKHFPNVKIFAVLREPVIRAFSDYVRGKKFHLKEDVDFETAFFAEKNRLYKKGDGYRARGYYYKQLKPYFDLFPRKNIKIIIYEEFAKDNEKAIRELYSFLGVNPDFKPSILGKRINERSGIRFRLLKNTINSLARVSRKLEAGPFGAGVYRFRRITKINELFNRIDNLNTKKDTEKDRLDPGLHKKLKKSYSEDIKKLEKLIKRNLSTWK